MKRFAYPIILICFCVWIIPLGAFIDISKEEVICNGKRAICLCTKLLKKRQHKRLEGTFLTASTAPVKDNINGNNSPDFLGMKKMIVNSPRGFVLNDQTFQLVFPSYKQQIEHVPKHS